MKVIVETPLSTFTGYGNDGIGLIQALQRWGADVFVNPKNVDPPLLPEIAVLLTRPLEKPFDLAIHHIDPMQMEMDPTKVLASKINVGWSMWEFSTVDNMKGKADFGKRTRFYDALIGYDNVTVEAFRPRMMKHRTVEPVTMPDGRESGRIVKTNEDVKLLALQGGYWPETWEKVERDWFGDRFGFCMVGQLHERKEPFLAIEAFGELKQDGGFDGAELHLKTQVPGLLQAMESVYPKLRVYYEHWPVAKLKQFYASQHVLLAPSRGEGKNMPALEMMSTGGTVIATNWGGHTQWIDDSIAYPIDYTLAPISGKYPNCMNARASKEHLKQLMWDAYSNRAGAKMRGDRAAKHIPQMCSWDAVVERLFLQLKHELGDKGQVLWEKAVACRRVLDED